MTNELKEVLQATTLTWPQAVVAVAAILGFVVIIGTAMTGDWPWKK